MKWSLLIPMLIALLLLAACSSQPTAPDKTIPFIGGNVGLDIGLNNGMPPAAVYDNARMPFSVGVMLQNVGEADIGPGTDSPFARVTVAGIRPAAFGVTAADLTQDLTDPLLGSHKNFDGTINPGMPVTVIFDSLNYQEDLQGNTVQNIIVDTCYDYKTLATTAICFKDDILENIEDAQICTLTGEKIPQNSGAPIQVTSLVENPLAPYKVMVNFIVDHVGTGDFYGRTADETCDPSVTNMNKYRVGVNVSSHDPDMDIKCTTLGGDGEGMITLYNGAPMTVTCTLDSSGNQQSRIYTEPLTITLKYRYGDSILQPIVIQAVNIQ